MLEEPLCDDEYEYYTDEDEADIEDEDEDDTLKSSNSVPDVPGPVRKDSAWRRKFDEEFNSPDSGRESATFDAELERIHREKERTALHHAVLCDDVFKLNKLLDEKADPNAQDGDGVTPVHLACMENRQNLTMILMSRGGDGAVIDSSRRTPLYYAVEKGYTRIVQTLLEYDTYMEGKDRNGLTVLHVAVAEEVSQTLQMLLSRCKKHGTEEDVARFVNNCNRDKQTAMHIASERSFCDGVKILISYKADLSLKDHEGCTPLHLACGSSLDSAMELQTTIVVENLTSHGAGVNAKDENGLTPLMYAARAGRTECAKILLSRGAQLVARDLRGLTALHHAARSHQPAKFIRMITKQGMPVDVKDKRQMTAMHHAISVNSLDAVKALCEAGADITMEDMEGRRYMEYSNIYGAYNILVWFARKYPELYINDDTKETVLHYAAAQGISEVVRVLLDSGCFSVDAGDESDKTPLHYAALNGADEVFQLLVENKADIDALDAVGATPLHFAVRWGSESIVKFILRNKGSDAVRILDSGDRLGRTPLHYAASQKTGLSYITNLLKAGANIDAQDHSGMTPLHLACRFGNISLVRMLIDEGASRGLEDAQGMSPLAHAREKDCITIIGMLEKADKRGRECSNRINC